MKPAWQTFRKPSGHSIRMLGRPLTRAASTGVFTNQPKGKGKSQPKGKNDAAKVACHEKCMRCGKYGHKVQFCPQSAGKERQAGKGLSFRPGQTPARARSRSSWSMQKPRRRRQSSTAGPRNPSLELGPCRLGFNPEKEISIDHRLRKTFIFGNNESSQALGLARMTTGIHGRETETEAHVVEGQTPLAVRFCGADSQADSE